MRKSAVILLIFLFSFSVFAQKTKKPRSTGKTRLVAAKQVGDEKAEFEKAVTQTSPAERIAALQEFLKVFPKSAEKTRAQELIVSARAELAEQKLQSGETPAGVELFKLAVREAPAPISERLFADVILTIPTNLFWRGQRAGAIEVVQLIEEKVSGDAKQLLGLATFHLGTENPAEAKRLAEKALALDANLTAAYQTLGLANRMGFRLEEAVAAYAKALELDPDSTVSKRSLAEMKRAVGKSDEAAALYREILLKDETDLAAQTGLALSLFDAEKRAEAEAQMAKTLEASPNNLFLLVGASYWYAAHNEGAKAVELAQKAIEIEPRYTWAHIALARGLMAQKKPLEAERTLLSARQYGNFPTLDYEIAAARAQAGFYREAAEELKKNFTVEDGLVVTRLGGRVTAEAKNFIELLSLERRASIFTPLAADSIENADRLKSLLDFSQKLNAAEPNETLIAQAVDEFVKGEDKMKIHRYLYAAERLLEKNAALPKVTELAQATIGNVEAGLDVAAPAAAVLADDLYQSRILANSRGEILLVPDVPRQTLSAILRGRVEEIAGWSLYWQNKTGESVVRLKRAVSVLPEKSTWWRSSMWRLGSALDADGRQAEALDAYVKSYEGGEASSSKYLVIETLYQKVNGSTEGLEAKIGAKPAILTQNFSTQTETVAKITEETKTEPTPEIKPETTLEVSPPPVEEKNTTQETTSPAETKVETSPNPTPELLTKTETTEPAAETTPTPEATPTATPEATPTPEETPTPTPEITPTPEESQAIVVKTPASEEIPPTVETTPTPPQNQWVVETQEVPRNRATIEVSPPPAEKTEEAKTTPADIKPKTPLASERVIVRDLLNPTPKAEKNVEIKESETVAKADTETKKNSKSLFDSVVISVPPPEKPKAAQEQSAETAVTENTQTENTQTPEIEKPVQTEDENKPPETEKTSVTRPRFIVTATEGIKPCAISASEENVSILSNGGSLGIQIAPEGSGSLGKITATSSSPRDVVAVLDKGISAVAKQTFFIIRSISTERGDFTITFESSCGKKQVKVNVR